MRYIFILIFSIIFLDLNINAQEITKTEAARIVAHINPVGIEKAVKEITAISNVMVNPYDSVLNSEIIQIKISEISAQGKSFNIKFNADEDIKKGDVLVWDFHFRSPWSENESGDGKISINLVNPGIVENGDQAYTVTANDNWKHFIKAFRAQTDMKKSETSIVVNLNFGLQAVELSTIKLYNYGNSIDESLFPGLKASYEGREEKAEWRTRAEERIDQYRKADLTVEVIKGKSRKAKGAEVEIKMLNHSFGFGSCTELADLIDESPHRELYRENFLKYFNKTTTERGLRWENWFKRTPSEQEKLKEDLDSMFAWFAKYDIPVRGHHLCWAKIDPRKQPDNVRDDPELLYKTYLEFQDQLVNFVGDRVTEWDAINHIAGNMVGPGKTYADLYGQVFWAEIINRARALAPETKMWINEGAIIARGNRIEAYLGIIDTLVLNNAAPDGIGFMAHFRESSLTPPDEVYKIMDRFAQKIPSLQLTELDVDVGTDEDLQADYFRDILTVSFSHPAMEGIILWGFWEGRHWRPDAALWRTDWSIKPAGQVWVDLVYNNWWTHEFGRTNDSGTYKNRVFKGKYEIIARYKGREIKQIIDIENDTSLELKF